MRVHLLLLTAYTIAATDANSTLASNTGSLSKPSILYSLLHNNTMHISCFSRFGPLPIRYQLFKNDQMRQEQVVNISEPANFTFAMSPEKQVYFNCKAVSPTGEMSSDNVTLRVGDPDDSAVAGEETETDHKDKENGPEHLIPLQFILTSVTPEVLERNTMVLIICGPILLLLLVIVIIITYLRSQKEQHMESLIPIDDSRSF